MATDIERLVLQLSADIRGLERSMDRAAKKTNDSTRQIERRFDTMNTRVAAAGQAMGRALASSIAAIGLGLAVRETAEFADAWTTARNRLAAAGVALEDVAAVQNRLVALSVETRTGLEQTVDLYARLTRATAQLGTSQQDVERATRIVNQAFVAGGAAASEQRSAILQLGQALGSGVLQGDELRALRENAPLLAQAIAREFNTTIAGLKQLGEEGRLVNERVFQAILNSGEDIGRQFAVTVPTISQGLQQVGTSLTRYIGQLDRTIGGTQVFNDVMTLLRENLDNASAALERYNEAQADTPNARYDRVLQDSAALVGNWRDAEQATQEQAEAVENLSDAELELRREQRRTGEYQKQRHIERLREIYDETQAIRQNYLNLLRDAERRNLNPFDLRAQADVNEYNDAITEANRRLRELEEQLGHVARQPLSVFADEAAESVGDLGDVVAGTSRTVSGYETDLEKLNRTVREVTQAHSELAEAAASALFNSDRAIALDDGSDGAYQRIQEAATQLDLAIQKLSGSNASREIVDAVVQYARSTNDIRRAVEAIDLAGSAIAPQDVLLAMEELRKLSDDLTGQILEGEDRAVADFQRKMDQIEEARSAAIALGIEDLGAYERAAAAAHAELAEALSALYDVENPFADFDLDSLTQDLPEFEVIGEEFRRVMRDSVKQAMKEGIQTDDWGTAFRGILADAIVAGLDDALNRLGDFLADFFFGTNGQQGFLNFVASSFALGGGRATGGPIQPFTRYPVNEQGAGEVLFVGKTAGEMLNAQQFRDLVGAGRGGVTLHLDNRMIIQGDMADSTLAKARAERQRSELLLMQKLPGVIDGRVNESIVHRRIRRS